MSGGSCVTEGRQTLTVLRFPAFKAPGVSAWQGQHKRAWTRPASNLMLPERLWSCPFPCLSFGLLACNLVCTWWWCPLLGWTE